MVNRDSKKLSQAIEQYLLRRIEQGYAEKNIHIQWKILQNFRLFVKRQRKKWDEIFTLETLRQFIQKSKRKDQQYAVRGLAKFLYKQKKISQSIPVKPRKKLPGIFEDFLRYCAETRYETEKPVQHIRRVLVAFHHYLERHNIRLSAITIEQIDAFEQGYNTQYAQQTKRLNRTCVRSFLKYLYQERQLLKKDIGALLKAPRTFHRTKPPCFLRPDEIQRLFASLELSTPTDLRAYALIHLAYTMGLRPQELCKLTLDDINFSKKEMHIKDRKASVPITLPIPQKTLKAVAAYLVGGRPDNEYRQLFLQYKSPREPIAPGTVHHIIKSRMRKAGLPEEASPYWLRHTYAQNLLEAGVSVFEIKEMLGHDDIDATRRYLHVHIKLMRRVILGEIV